MNLYNDGSDLQVGSISEDLTDESSPADIRSSGQSFMDNIIPDSLEFLSEETTTMTSPILTNIAHMTDNPIPPQSDDLGFLVCEDSIAMSEVHFDHISTYVDNSTVSPCFSKDRQLVCEDSVESVPREAASIPHFQDCKSPEDDDFLLATAEETSMDSGLGSVESVYPNSEEESTGILSPDPLQPMPSSSALEERVGAPSLESSQILSSSVLSKSDHPVSPIGRKYSDNSNSADVIFYDCLSDLSCDRNPKKRSHDYDSSVKDQPLVKKQRTAKRVSFENVTVFYFQRKQGFVSVPSQGGSTLGMAMQHSHHSTLSIQEHNFDLKRRHKDKVMEHMREQKIEDKIKQLKFMNPELDNGALSSMARSVVGEVAGSLRRDDDSLLENYDEFFFLQPISAKKRRKILRLAGVDRIDGEEKFINRILRESRELCGCSCQQVCDPETCECALAGIQCQVDREAFPCGCIVSGCQNENGRIEFDSERVRLHLLATLEKLQSEESNESQNEFNGEQTASSESECDFMSSDDADQSDSEAVEIHHCSQSSTTVETVHITLPENNPTESEEPEIPQQYLNTLGLKKVEIKTESDECSHLSTPVLYSANGNLHQSVMSYESYYSGPHPCSFNTIESLAQSVPDPPPPPARQMYGTTSPVSYCQGTSLATRDLSIPLEPIATFMTANYNIATTESLSCSSTF